MPKLENDLRTAPSIVDRLLDDGEADQPVDFHHGLPQLKQSVGRDLEALLNTRRELLNDLSPEFTETSHSILTYGLPDFSSFNLASPGDRNHVRRALEEAIATFEPRLDRVRVVLEEARAYDHGLHFRIEAVLQVDPAPERVTFDAVLQLTTHEYRVQEPA